MNKPVQVNPRKFDEDGEPEWNSESQARMDAINRSPEMLEVRKRLAEDAAAGITGYTTEETRAHLAEFRRKWLAARGL